MTASLELAPTAAPVAPLVSLRPAPRREPPFDDEILEAAHGRRYDQRLPILLHGPLGGLGCQAAAEPLALDPTLPDPRLPDSRLPDPRLPDPSRWGRSLLIGIIETASGKRPLQQLGAMFSLSVSSGLGRDFERAARLGRPHWTAGSTVRSVHASRTSERVAEVSATLQAGDRVRAAAMRLESNDGRWRCTRLHLG